MSKVDRELARIEARRAEEREVAESATPKRKRRGAVKRAARDLLVRRTSTKQ